MYSASASNWNAGNAIDGSAYGSIVGLNLSYSDNAVYDLTANSLSNIKHLFGAGGNLTVQINSAIAGGVALFEGKEPMTNW